MHTFITEESGAVETLHDGIRFISNRLSNSVNVAASRSLGETARAVSAGRSSIHI